VRWWTTLVVALGFLMAFGTGAYAQTPSGSGDKMDQDKIMDKDNKDKMKDKMKDKKMMDKKHDKMMEKKDDKVMDKKQ
jgi:hypothetical protein